MLPKGYVPGSISLEAHVLGLDFHPKDSLVAACLVNGLAHCFQYNMKEEDEEAEDYEELLYMEHHSKSVRDIKFSIDGNALFTVSRDKSFASVDVETGRLLFQKEKAHGIAINRVHPISYNWVATGDDLGRVKIWDSRMEKVVQRYEDNEDFIADMLYVPEKKRLLAAGGDGYLSVFDVRRPDIVARSDNLEDELLSLAVVKNGAKLICGSQGGILNIFHWDDWGDIKDRMPGHPSSVDTICAWDDDIVLTGSSDGLIRACHILPNKFIGCIGEHDHFPVERIALTHDRRFLGSCSHDQTIRFWNVEAALEALMNEDENEDEDDEEDEEDSDDDDKLSEESDTELQSSTESDKKGKEEDSDEEMDDSDDDDSDDEDKKKKKKKRNRTKLKNVKILKRPKKAKSTSASSFFADLS